MLSLLFSVFCWLCLIATALISLIAGAWIFEHLPSVLAWFMLVATPLLCFAIPFAISYTVGKKRNGNGRNAISILSICGMLFFAILSPIITPNLIREYVLISAYSQANFERPSLVTDDLNAAFVTISEADIRYDLEGSIAIRLRDRDAGAETITYRVAPIVDPSTINASFVNIWVADRTRKRESRDSIVTGENLHGRVLFAYHRNQYQRAIADAVDKYNINTFQKPVIILLEERDFESHLNRVRIAALITLGIITILWGALCFVPCFSKQLGLKPNL